MDERDEPTCQELVGEDWENWPDCIVPDCAYKVCLWLSVDKCFNHALGRTPPDPAEYFAERGDSNG